MAEESKDLIFDKLIKKKEDVCIIGYGQSGSGKTSSLIYLKTSFNYILQPLPNYKNV
jgi:ABC-type thiamine transport system ATPase subunit